jgi:hypothetical protein
MDGVSSSSVAKDVSDEEKVGARTSGKLKVVKAEARAGTN